MLASVRLSRVLVASLALAVASPAFAATISHASPHQPVATDAVAVASPASTLPYSCAKSELNTRLMKRVCE